MDLDQNYCRVYGKKGQNELMRIDDHQLTISQKKEWLGIGQAIFDWCCSGKSKN